tara:strand:+ start:3365 stop:3604 length:240 start_codon:yes stop_codon:yes gene_type:complete
MENREIYTVELREDYEGVLVQTLHMTYAGALASAHEIMQVEGGVWEDIHFDKDITVNELLREWQDHRGAIQIRKKFLAD